MNDPLGWLVWLASVDAQMSLQSFRCPYTSSRALGNLFFLFGFILILESVAILFLFRRVTFALHCQSDANDRHRANLCEAEHPCGLDSLLLATVS
jgi:hypothetical protein